MTRDEQRYRSLVLSTAAVLWTTDVTGNVAEPQPGWEAFTGQSWVEHRGNAG
jgi:hypothetical protein